MKVLNRPLSLIRHLPLAQECQIAPVRAFHTQENAVKARLAHLWPILGLLFLLNNFHVFDFFRIAEFWPVVLIAVGLLMFRKRLGGGGGGSSN